MALYNAIMVARSSTEHIPKSAWFCCCLGVARCCELPRNPQTAKFAESGIGEVRRILILGTSVNKHLNHR
jgi:hypothetical protein